MGDRISIQFVQNDYKSCIFYSHWCGYSIVDCVKQYMKQLKQKVPTNMKVSHPLNRREPDMVFTDFVRWFFETLERGEPLLGDYRILGKDEINGDDNGHWLIDTNTGKIRKVA